MTRIRLILSRVWWRVVFVIYTVIALLCIMRGLRSRRWRVLMRTGLLLTRIRRFPLGLRPQRRNQISTRNCSNVKQYQPNCFKILNSVHFQNLKTFKLDNKSKIEILIFCQNQFLVRNLSKSLIIEDESIHQSFSFQPQNTLHSNLRDNQEDQPSMSTQCYRLLEIVYENSLILVMTTVGLLLRVLKPAYYIFGSSKSPFLVFLSNLNNFEVFEILGFKDQRLQPLDHALPSRHEFVLIQPSGLDCFPEPG